MTWKGRFFFFKSPLQTSVFFYARIYVEFLFTLVTGTFSSVILNLIIKWKTTFNLRLWNLAKSATGVTWPHLVPIWLQQWWQQGEKEERKTSDGTHGRSHNSGKSSHLLWIEETATVMQVVVSGGTFLSLQGLDGNRRTWHRLMWAL